jgi:hypothetical protein
MGGERAPGAATFEELLDLLYATISFPPGGRPDWESERRLMAPQAQLTRLTDDLIESFDVAGYQADFEAKLAAGWLPAGLDEREIARRVDRFGDVAHAWSTYEARSAPGAPVLFRGINSIQARRRDGRWQVVSILWFRESERTPIPAEYLPPSS